MNMKRIYKVHLHIPHNGKQDYYFRSKNAIFRELGREVVGVGQAYISNRLIDKEHPYTNAKCIITAETVQ